MQLSYLPLRLRAARNEKSGAEILRPPALLPRRASGAHGVRKGRSGVARSVGRGSRIEWGLQFVRLEVRARPTPTEGYGIGTAAPIEKDSNVRISPLRRAVVE